MIEDTECLQPDDAAPVSRPYCKTGQTGEGSHLGNIQEHTQLTTLIYNATCVCVCECERGERESFVLFFKVSRNPPPSVKTGRGEVKTHSHLRLRVIFSPGSSLTEFSSCSFIVNNILE